MSVTNFLIPLSNVPEQFEITLAGVNYQMTSKWNDADDAGWVIDIAASDGTPIVCNIPLITGADLLDGLEYLGLGGKLYVMTNGSSPFDTPTLDNLGADSNLYFQVSS